MLSIYARLTNNMCRVNYFSVAIIVIVIFISNLLAVNTDKVNLMKCCAGNEVVLSNICTHYDGVLDFSNVIIYNEDMDPTTQKVKDIFYLIKNKTFFNPDYVMKLDTLNHYLTKDGTLHTEYPNMYDRWTTYDRKSFCVDYYLTNISHALSVKWWLLVESDSPETEHVAQDPKLTIPAMFVSSFFFALVLVVYALLPELRNLHGLVLMAYVVSMIGTFCTVAIFQLLSFYVLNSPEVCFSMTFTAYYFIISSFFWMNVMSFDIWWTFRGYAKARLIHRRGEMCKFYTYCAYAFGVPAAMTIAAIIIDNMDLRHIPWFVKPNITPDLGCFLDGPQRFIYLYMPMLIILLMNWILFLMTAYNIWRLHRGTAMLDKGGNRKHHNQRQRFYVYLKLSVIMGTSWVLEVLSRWKPDSFIWKLTDGYNLLIGVITFIIFICKRKILRKLMKRLRKDNGNIANTMYCCTRDARSNSCAMDLSNTCNMELRSSVDNLMAVSFNPDGNKN